MSIETLSLIQQLQQKPKFEQLINHDAHRTEHIQKIAAINRPKLPPNYLIRNRKEILREMSPDNEFVELKKNRSSRVFI
jgi:hypothetical protein